MRYFKLGPIYYAVEEPVSSERLVPATLYLNSSKLCRIERTQIRYDIASENLFELTRKEFRVKETEILEKMGLVKKKRSLLEFLLD